MYAIQPGTILRAAVASLRDFSSVFLWKQSPEDDRIQAGGRRSGRRCDQFLLGRLLARRLLPPRGLADTTGHGRAA
jgi:hypothetical protein